MDDQSDPRGALIYAEAIRALDAQSTLLDEIRNRAGILLAASSIATSFLAGTAIPKDGNLSILSVLAGAAFLVAAGLCVRLLVPRGNWRFRMEGTKAIRCRRSRILPSRDHRNSPADPPGWVGLETT